MTPAERWLRERLADAPPRLLEAMLGALPADRAEVPYAFAEGALALYARVVGSGSGGREDALPLLAADALYTHALEAQAEIDPAGIAALARWMGGSGELRRIADRSTGIG